jgi:hypothetical protein
MVRTRICIVVLLAAACFTAVAPASGRTAPRPRQGDAKRADLFTRVGLTPAEAASARHGQPAVRVLPSSVETEVAVAGAIRIRGDLERLVAWLRDIEEFRRSLGSDDVVGAIDSPPRAENFAAISAARLDMAELERCRPGRCAIRMPAAYITRFSKEVPWGTSEAPAAAAGLVRQLLAHYAAAYQTGGDRALGAHHNQQDPEAIANAFKDLLRRAVPLWQLAYGFAAYLEEYPAHRPEGVEDRFYWTREVTARSPVTTLHHVVLERLQDRSLRFADKQFYASRDIDAALLVGQATPTEDGRTFDLVVSVRARVPKLGSVAAKLLRQRLGREIADSFATYLEWLQRSFALG